MKKNFNKLNLFPTVPYMGLLKEFELIIILNKYYIQKYGNIKIKDEMSVVHGPISACGLFTIQRLIKFNFIINNC